MKKHLANIVSLSRVAGSVVLFCCNSLSKTFLAVYIFCGFTDLIDGPMPEKQTAQALSVLPLTP